MSQDCDYYGRACQKLGEDGEYHCLNCWSTNGLQQHMFLDDAPGQVPLH